MFVLDEGMILVLLQLSFKFLPRAVMKLNEYTARKRGYIVLLGRQLCTLLLQFIINKALELLSHCRLWYNLQSLKNTGILICE